MNTAGSVTGMLLICIEGNKVMLFMDSFHDSLYEVQFVISKKKMCFYFPGFVGVYMAGHILETTKNWNLVFTQTIEVIFVGWFIFFIFGTGNRIV